MLLYYKNSVIVINLLAISLQRGNPLEKLFFFIGRKEQVKWETPKEDNTVFVLF